jgi:hypothetical protein
MDGGYLRGFDEIALFACVSCRVMVLSCNVHASVYVEAKVLRLEGLASGEICKQTINKWVLPPFQIHIRINNPITM